MKNRILLSLGVIILTFCLTTKIAQANEGLFVLKNQIGGNTSCEASSVLMENLNYVILLSCRNLNYPGGERISYYILWGQPQDGGKPFRLGEIGLGKAEFQTRTPFSTLFITRELNKNSNTPTTPVIAQGSLNQLSFNQENSTPQPAGAVSTPSPTPAPISQKQPTLGERITKVTGIVAIIGLVVLIAFVFLLIRPR
jgi:hypothetical protein